MRTGGLIDAENSAEIPDAHFADGESADYFGSRDVAACGEELRQRIKSSVPRNIAHHCFFGFFVDNVFHS